MLGLPVALGIVQAHGGGIIVQSKPSQGTTFRVYRPMAMERILPAQGSQAPVSRLGPSGAILLMDDDQMLVESTPALIGMVGFSVLTAKDGLEAMEGTPTSPG